MKLTPLYDKILVRRDDAASQSAAGIIIPDAAKEKPNSGVVLSVGEGRLCPAIAGYEGDNIKSHVEPLRVKAGDRILFQTYAGTEIADSESKAVLLLMSEDDVLAIVGEEPV